MWEILEHGATLNRSFTGHPDSVEGLDLSGFSDFSFVLWNFRQLNMFTLASRTRVATFWLWREELVGRKESLHSKEVRRRGKVITAGYSPSNPSAFDEKNWKDTNTNIEPTRNYQQSARRHAPRISNDLIKLCRRKKSLYKKRKK